MGVQPAPTSLDALLAIGALVAMVGPPVWWCGRSKKPGERRTASWGTILLGLHLIVAAGLLQPAAKGDWTGWIAQVSVIEAGVGSIAIGARGSPD